jgi:hypothetical protein
MSVSSKLANDKCCVSTLEESRKQKEKTQTPLPLQTIEPRCPWHSRSNLLKSPFLPLENTSSIPLSKGKEKEKYPMSLQKSLFWKGDEENCFGKGTFL